MLRSTILRGQETSWALSRRFIIECLKRNRSIHRNFSNGRLPPPYQPVFATIDTYKASFPPSQSTYNLALRYFETNNAISSSIFLEKAASLGIAREEVPDVWISILSIRDRLGSGAEDAIRNGTIPEDMIASSATGVCLYPEDKLRRTPKEKVIRYAPSSHKASVTGAGLTEAPNEAPIIFVGENRFCRRGRPFIASVRTLKGTVWSTFGQGSSTLVRNKFIVVEEKRYLRCSDQIARWAARWVYVGRHEVRHVQNG